MAFLSEAEVENALLDQLRALGYAVEREEDIGRTVIAPSARAMTRWCSKRGTRITLH